MVLLRVTTARYYCTGYYCTGYHDTDDTDDHDTDDTDDHDTDGTDTDDTPNPTPMTHLIRHRASQSVTERH